MSPKIKIQLMCWGRSEKVITLRRIIPIFPPSSFLDSLIISIEICYYCSRI